MKSQKKSKAFTLIEVILSIVIIGIVMTTIPMIMTAFTTASKTNVKEEVFFAQFSLLTLISSKYFDQNNSVGDNYYKDLNTTATGDADSKLDIYSYGTELDRRGKHQISQGDKLLSYIEYRSGSKYTLSKIGVDAGEDEHNESTFNDVDDYNGYVVHHAGVGSKGFDLNVSVKYIPDTANYDDVEVNFTYSDNTKQYTNIKLITITTKIDNQTIKLSYPTCNIGASAMLSYK